MSEHLDDCEDCQRERSEHKEFGMFGLELPATKRMLNKLLKPYGLQLKVRHFSRWGDKSEVQIVPIAKGES